MIQKLPSNSFGRILVTLLILCSVLTGFSQEWKNYLPKDKAENGTLTLFDYQAAFNQYWDAYDVDNGYYMLNGEKHKAYGWKQFKRWEWFWESRVNPITGAFPNESALEVFAAYNVGRSTTSSSGDWTSLGPNSTNGGYAGLGRLNCVGFHPTDNDIFYVGAAAGGIWKTTDGGNNWTPISDSIASLGISDIKVTVEAGNEIIYIATGDRDHSDTYSVGVLKSTDGGNTWNTSGLDWTQNQKDLVNRLLIDQDAPDTLYAATSNGLFQTVDGGDNWTLKTSIQFIDIEFMPGNTAQIYGSNKSGSVYRSTNYGSTWSQVLSVSGGQRTELAVTADNSSIVYALVSNSNSGLLGIYKSTDSGTNFSQVFSGSTANLMDWSCDGGDSGGQAWYDLCIAADPNDENVVYVGGVNTWKSTNGGTNWSINNHWYGGCGVPAAHADKHYFAYQNGSSTLFECNDGGLYKTSNGGSSWTHLGSGLVVSQIYRLGVAQTVDDEVITGLQDNGTKSMFNGNWYDVIGGDGMDCLIDYTDEEVQYGSLYYGQIYRTTDHWANDTRIDDNGISENGAWVTPYCLDRNDHETIYAGFSNVWKSTNRGNSWTKISTWGSGTLKSLAVGYNSDYIYAASYGTIHMTSNGGASWANVTSGLPVSSSDITFITVKDDDPNTVWVTLSGFNGYGVYESTNGGDTWTNISSGLPQLPVNCVVQDTSNTNLVLYAGTDVGVYVKDGSNNWAPFYNGLPNVVVTELEIYYDNNESDSRIRAATFGRGVWESDLYTTTLAPVADFTVDEINPPVTDTVSFTDQSTNSPTAWDWVIDPATVTYVNGTDAGSQNPMVRFDAVGIYTVELTASNAGGSDTETKTDYINVMALAPICDFEADTTHPSSVDTVLFTDLSINVPDTWDWTFSPQTITFLDGTDANSQNPKVRFDEEGLYTVTLTATNAGGSDDETKVDYMDVVGVLTVSATSTPESICEGGSSQLGAIPGGGEGNITYSWTSDPAGFTSDQQNPIVEPEVNTTYFVEVSDGLQSAADDVNVTVNSLPEIILGDWPDALCNQEEPPVQLTATPEGGVYAGNFVTPDGLFSPENADLGWNVITYTYEDGNGCENAAQDSIFVDDCVGINPAKINQPDIVVYPNPSNGKFIVESNTIINNIEVVNLVGKVVYTSANNKNSMLLNVNLEKGIYFLKVRLTTGNNGVVWNTKKIIIE
jgi:PKD repeat protein